MEFFWQVDNLEANPALKRRSLLYEFHRAPPRPVLHPYLTQTSTTQQLDFSSLLVRRCHTHIVYILHMGTTCGYDLCFHDLFLFSILTHLHPHTHSLKNRWKSPEGRSAASSVRPASAGVRRAVHCCETVGLECCGRRKMAELASVGQFECHGSHALVCADS